MRLEEFFAKYARGAGVGIGRKFARELRAILSVQAPLRTTRGGRVVAATRATPFAPPRRVTGALQGSVREIPTKHGLRVVVFKPYSVPLEKSSRWYGWPHRFVQPVLRMMGLVGRAS